MELVVCSRSVNQTKETGQYFSAILEKGSTVFLSGELGAGKTAFVSGVMKGFGFSGEINSPSFTILNLYKVSRNLTVVHADFYRLNSYDEIADTGIEEFLYDLKFITLIEWPDKLKDFLKKDYVDISFGYEIEDFNSRQIRISSFSRFWGRKLNLFENILRKKCII
jgi:tRNA threonylcarbamoyladenosine biosynthesis protein TsaE